LLTGEYATLRSLEYSLLLVAAAGHCVQSLIALARDTSGAKLTTRRPEQGRSTRVRAEVGCAMDRQTFG
jgi:hypothetical protein